MAEGLGQRERCSGDSEGLNNPPLTSVVLQPTPLSTDHSTPLLQPSKAWKLSMGVPRYQHESALKPHLLAIAHLPHPPLSTPDSARNLSKPGTPTGYLPSQNPWMADHHQIQCHTIGSKSSVSILGPPHNSNQIKYYRTRTPLRLW